MESIIDRQVAARNALNAKVNELRPALQEALKPFVGKKVLKGVPSTWTKKVKEVLDKVEEECLGDYRTSGWHFYYVFSIPYVWGHLKTSYPVSDCVCEYVNEMFYVCSLDGYGHSDVLSDEWKVVPMLKCDYSASEIANAKRRIAELDREISELKGFVSRFGR